MEMNMFIIMHQMMFPHNLQRLVEKHVLRVNAPISTGMVMSPAADLKKDLSAKILNGSSFRMELTRLWNPGQYLKDIPSEDQNFKRFKFPNGIDKAVES